MRKQIRLFLMGIAIMMLFVSCGKEEEQQQESGAGGRLYCSGRGCIYDITVAQDTRVRVLYQGTRK